MGSFTIDFSQDQHLSARAFPMIKDPSEPIDCSTFLGGQGPSWDGRARYETPTGIAHAVSSFPSPNPGLDEWTDLSLFDTDIVSAKARQEGFTAVVCRDMFIHHFGTRTFAHGAPPMQSDGGRS
jgi:hypothetical protein